MEHGIERKWELQQTHALLAMSRELLQTDDAASVLRLAGAAVSELTHAGAALLVVSGRAEGAAFDRAGQLLPSAPEPAWQAIAGQLLQRAPAAPVFGNMRLAALPEAALPRMLGVATPAVQPVAALVAGWDDEASDAAWRERRRMLETILELTAAALGRIEEYELLARRVSEQDRKIATTAEAHASELARRDTIERDMRLLSLTDVLTGLNNRRGFFVQGEQAFRQARRSGGRSAVIYAGIDGLKLVNDDLGHGAGDALIRDAATVFRASFRDADVVARIGGDEFIAYTLGDDQPVAILDRLQANLHAFKLMQERPYDIAISAGIVACSPDENAGLFDYVQRADRQMGFQKRRRLH